MAKILSLIDDTGLRSNARRWFRVKVADWRACEGNDETQITLERPAVYRVATEIEPKQSVFSTYAMASSDEKIAGTIWVSPELFRIAFVIAASGDLHDLLQNQDGTPQWRALELKIASKLSQLLRFFLAHEIGHAVLGKDASEEDCDDFAMNLMRKRGGTQHTGLFEILYDKSEGERQLALGSLFGWYADPKTRIELRRRIDRLRTSGVR